MISTNTLDLAQALIRLPSISPDDAGCQLLIADRLSKHGFHIEHLPFGDVSNLWATHGTGAPFLVFAGHTDVVPPGPIEQWDSPPFTPTLRDDFLYGRGAADMKGGLAAMITATEQFIAQHPNHPGTIAFLITSDEEADAVNGTRKVMAYLQKKGVQFDWCVIGEPSSEQRVGDTIKIGRRGSLSATITFHGKQGHVAYPHLADNPIPNAIKALTTLCDNDWGKGADAFPETTFQISNLHAGTGANNVIPEHVSAQFNFRYPPPITATQLQKQVNQILRKHAPNHTLTWSPPAQPFLSRSGKLLDVAKTVVKEVTNIEPEISTSGGTSDGRFIAPSGCELFELGLCRETIHQINECIQITDLEQLTLLYERLLVHLYPALGKKAI